MKSYTEGILVFEETREYEKDEKKETSYLSHYLVGDKLDTGLYECVPEILMVRDTEKKDYFGKGKPYKALIKYDEMIIQGKGPNERARTYRKILDVKVQK